LSFAKTVPVKTTTTTTQQPTTTISSIEYRYDTPLKLAVVAALFPAGQRALLSVITEVGVSYFASDSEVNKNV